MYRPRWITLRASSLLPPLIILPSFFLCSLQLEIPPGRDAEQTRAAAHKTHRKLTEEKAAKVRQAMALVLRQGL